MAAKAPCPTTHPQLLAGNCPWCGTPIGSQPTATGPECRSAADRRWDISRMKSDLNRDDEVVGIITVLNAHLHSSGMPQAVDVLCAAMRNSVDRVKAHATTALELLGDKISAEAIKDHEAASLSQPDDIGLRILLLGHYSQRQFVADAARMARQAHILWIIEHAPETSIAGSNFADLDYHMDGAAYEQARQLWMSQIETNPQNIAILGNAASFLTLCDKTKCGELLRRAKTLEPDNPRWTERLAHLYSLEMRGKDDAARQDWAAMAQAEYESGLGLYRNDRARLGRLPDLAPKQA
jgi:hypothetical protein